MTLRNLGIAWVVCLAAIGTSPSAGAGGPVRLALIPMVVHSAESPEYLRAGLADMLSARFEQIDALEVVRIEDTSLATSRIESALEAGRRAGADFVLFGSFTRFGQGASLDVQCAATEVAPHDSLRKIFVHSGSIGDVIPDLDDLVGKVTRFLVEDFRDAGVSTAAEASVTGPASVGELQRRIEALEQALGRLTAGEGPTSAVQPAHRGDLSLR